MDEKYITTTLPKTILRTEANSKAEVAGIVPEGTQLEVIHKGEEFTEVLVWLAGQGQVVAFAENKKIGLYAPSISPKETPKLCICGADNWKGVYYSTGQRMYGPSIPTGFFTSIPVRTRICLECGRLEQYVEVDLLEDIRKIED